MTATQQRNRKQTIDGPVQGRHRKRVDAIRALAEALPAGEVRVPDLPISRVVEEGFGILIGCRAHAEALEEVGLKSDQVERFRELNFALQSAQAILEATRLGVEAASGRAAIERAARMRDRVFTLAEAASEDLRECAEFAFRKDRTDERRVLFRSAFRRRHEFGYRTLRDSDEFDVWRPR
ncbi:MAG: hypothetical protein JRF63_08575 [Deltaproteobacteria bacterium]|nr:hypothetical protein [Deltaproteobacteria bacterium]